ncbi:MAG: hypothetical protein ACKVU1_03000 [bacterium]
MNTPRKRAIMAKSMRIVLGLIAMAAVAAGCLVSPENVRFDELVAGRVTLIQVPDTTSSDSLISVRIKGEAGPSSAYRLEIIETRSRNRTWTIEPRIRHYEERDVTYLPVVSTFDVTIQLEPFEAGYTYFEVVALDTTILDSTLVVPAEEFR